MKKGKVIITGVKEVKNGAYQLTLSQSVTDENNVVGFFMQGHDGIAGVERNRVTWQTVSRQMMEKYHFAEGQILDDIIRSQIGKECNIQVNEGFTARTWVGSDGVLQTQKEKINPKTNAPLLKDGRRIYRNTSLVFGNAEDVVIKHDVVTTTSVSATAEPAAANA